MKESNVYKNKHKGEGHRSRLRKRFLENGINSLLDYEVIELLLTIGTPRKDCKQTAKDALKKFGSLRNVLEATDENLKKIKGIGPSNIFGLKLFQAVSERLAKESIPKKLNFASDRYVVNYLQQSIGKKQKEHFIAFYLDSNSNVIQSKIISIGIVDSSLVHPREVFEPAISCLAASIIIAHNHPSGFIEPSSDDREITKLLVETGKIVGIQIKDHIIVSSIDYFSFKQQLIL